MADVVDVSALKVKLQIFQNGCIDLDPLNPHDASKHHFASLTNDSISLKPMNGFWTEKFHGTVK